MPSHVNYVMNRHLIKISSPLSPWERAGVRARRHPEPPRERGGGGPGISPHPDPLPGGEGAAAKSTDVAALEDRFRQALGTKVQLYRGRRGGRLVVHFYSDDELQGLYDAICGPEPRR